MWVAVKLSFIFLFARLSKTSFCNLCSWSRPICWTLYWPHIHYWGMSLLHAGMEWRLQWRSFWPTTVPFQNQRLLEDRLLALCPSPLTSAPSTALGEMLEVSAQAVEQPLLLASKSQHLNGTAVLPCLCWQSLAVPGEPGQHGNCPQPSLMARRSTHLHSIWGEREISSVLKP